ncbi:alpha/beta hydrolase family protein [Actinacidiphila acididurans]|uniref:Alpha/beta hydrolase n=1 Tax=Actinacidiphila acididurans TaxID=2784346 RepID=A0ABS2TSB4_9ACTN|nr:hypothetical protein [Actinacidiphila acididurans]MBM9505891.1 hypothetical protein [Actinacidiphila acididurans]
MPLFLTAALPLLAGCADDGTDGKAVPAPVSSAGPDDFGCLSPEQARTGSVTFPAADGQQVEAYTTGTGSTALVLAHQADGDVCQWVPDATRLAKDGYRVVAVNSAGSEVAELTAAVAYVRARGAGKVLLIGASKGGTAALSAAGSITPAVDAVVSLSAPTAYGGMDASTVVPRLTMPVLYMAAHLDTAFADSTRQLSRATGRAPVNDLWIVSGARHGVSMLGDETNFARVEAFLKKYGR